MKDDKLEYASEVVGEVVGVFEDEIIKVENEYLFRYRNLLPDFWEKRQYSKLKELQKDFEKRGQNFLENIHKAIKKTVEVSYEDEPKRDLQKIEKSLNEEVDEKTKIVLKLALLNQKRKIKQVVSRMKTEELANAIEKVTLNGINQGLKVRTKSGQNWGIKEYLEMQTRSIPQKENLENLISSGTSARIVFYICNSFRDCATDHAKYQGLKYYDKNYKDFGLPQDVELKITDFIKKNRLVSIQQITEEKPFLTTRPNCRHRFTPLSLEQAMKIPSFELLRTFNISSGRYKKENYSKTQMQRAYERKIRNLRYEISEIRDLPTKDVKILTIKVKTLKNAENGLKTLLEQNKFLLQRDERRETRKIIVQDLGARYKNGIDIT